MHILLLRFTIKVDQFQEIVKEILFKFLKVDQLYHKYIDSICKVYFRIIIYFLIHFIKIKFITEIDHLSLFDSSSRNHNELRKLPASDINSIKDNLKFVSSTNHNSKTSLLDSSKERSHSRYSKSPARSERISFSKPNSISFSKK